MACAQRKPCCTRENPVERVTGIEPAWPAWKASGTRSRLSVKMAVDLPVCVFDLDRCGPYQAPLYRPYGPARHVSVHLIEKGFVAAPSTRWEPRSCAASPRLMDLGNRAGGSRS